MSEQFVAHIHHKACKGTKLETVMTKELKKAAKARDEKIRYKFTKDKVEFKGRREVIDRNKIDNKRKNRENRIIVLATKADKNRYNVYALKFADDANFNDFFEKVSAKPSPNVTSTNENQPASQDQNVSESTQRHQGKSPTLNAEPSISYKSPSPLPIAPPPPPQRAPSRPTSPTSEKSESPTTLDESIHEQPKPSQKTKSPQVLSSYITTDVLNAPKRASSPKKGYKKLSSNDVYPMEGRSESRRQRGGTNVNYYNYIPGKGMVKSSDGNIYACASRIRSESESSFSSLSSSASNMSDSSISDPTSTTDIFEKTTVFRLVQMDDANSAGPVNRNGSGSVNSTSSRSSSSSSTSSSTVRNQQPPKINVWRYRDSRSSSSSSSSDSSSSSVVPVEKLRPRSSRSRSRGAGDVQICPTCHHRSRSRGRAY